MTLLDMIVLGVLATFMYIGFKRGLIKTLFGLASNIIGIIIAYIIYPYVSAFLLKNTGLKKFIQGKISESLRLSELAGSAVGKQAQEAAVDSLKIPKFFKELLVNNNNDEVYRLLDVTSLQDYISGTLATVAINALTFILVAVIVILIMNILSGSMNLISKLPIISQANHMGGLIAGTAWGVTILWLGGLFLTFVSSMQKGGELMALLGKSPIALFFFQENLLMGFVADFTKTLIS